MLLPPATGSAPMHLPAPAMLCPAPAPKTPFFPLPAPPGAFPTQGYLVVPPILHQFSPFGNPRVPGDHRVLLPACPGTGDAVEAMMLRAVHPANDWATQVAAREWLQHFLTQQTFFPRVETCGCAPCVALARYEEAHPSPWERRPGHHSLVSAKERADYPCRRYCICGVPASVDSPLLPRPRVSCSCPRCSFSPRPKGYAFARCFTSRDPGCRCGCEVCQRARQPPSSTASTPTLRSTIVGASVPSSPPPGTPPVAQAPGQTPEIVILAPSPGPSPPVTCPPAPLLQEPDYAPPTVAGEEKQPRLQALRPPVSELPPRPKSAPPRMGCPQPPPTTGVVIAQPSLAANMSMSRPPLTTDATSSQPPPATDIPAQENTRKSHVPRSRVPQVESQAVPLVRRSEAATPGGNVIGNVEVQGQRAVTRHGGQAARGDQAQRQQQSSRATKREKVKGARGRRTGPQKTPTDTMSVLYRGQEHGMWRVGGVYLHVGANL